MGLFTQRPEEPTEWAGLPSEPERTETEAERLRNAAPSLDALGIAGSGAVESIVIPVPPIVEVAQEASGDGEPGDEPGGGEPVDGGPGRDQAAGR